MATPTDLAGFLRNDEDNLSLRISQWNSNPGDGPWQVRILYRADGAVSEEKLATLPIAKMPCDPDLLVDEIEDVIQGRLGPSPIGKIRVRGWGRRQSRSPELDFQRTLISEAMLRVGGDPNVALLERELRQAYAQIQHLTTQLVAMGSNLATVAGSQAKQLQQLATARATTGVISESGSLPALLGLLLVPFVWPFILRAMKLPTDAGLQEVMDRARLLARMGPDGANTASSDRSDRPPPPPPPRAGARPSHDTPPGSAEVIDGEADVVDDGELSSADRQALAQQLVSLFDDPAVLEDVALRVVGERPELAPQLMRLREAMTTPAK